MPFIDWPNLLFRVKFGVVEFSHPDNVALMLLHAVSLSDGVLL